MDNSQKAYWNLISRLGFVRVKQVCEGPGNICFLVPYPSLLWKLAVNMTPHIYMRILALFLKSHFFTYIISQVICLKPVHYY